MTKTKNDQIYLLNLHHRLIGMEIRIAYLFSLAQSLTEIRQLERIDEGALKLQKETFCLWAEKTTRKEKKKK